MKRLLLLPVIALLLCFKDTNRNKPLPAMGKIDNSERLEHHSMACRQ